MTRIPDHPAIRAAEKYGYSKTPVWPICPICGGECEYIVRNGGEIIGCSLCTAIKVTDAWEEDECFPESEE